MMRRAATLLTLAACALLATQGQAQDFRIGLLPLAQPATSASPARSGGEILADMNARPLAFVVSNGIKTAAEPCTDSLYEDRLAQFDTSQHPLVVSLAASDWTGCLDAARQPVGAERLARLRELLFADAMSLGTAHLPLTRQSTSAIFRRYAENARWTHNGVLFATLHVPGNNNNFVRGAGRNGEFEDRAVATREWLQRVFALAAREKRTAIVLFTDANPFAAPLRPDGYDDLRRLLQTLAAGFRGKVLLVHGQPAPGEAALRWQRNLGSLSMPQAAATSGKDWLELRIRPAAAEPFRLGAPARRPARPAAPAAPAVPSAEPSPSR